MIWALVENEKIEASPKTKGICLICGGKMHSKCGEVNVWHWAHDNNENCDLWYEPESIWHKHWKMTFGKENSEIGIEKQGTRHIADIRTNGNVVIELQNSPLLKPIIRERENFYGERMLWLLNGEKFKTNLVIKEFFEDKIYLERKMKIRWLRDEPDKVKEPDEEYFKWKNPRKSWVDVQRPLFIDFGEESLFKVIEGMGTSQIRGKYISKEKFIQKYGGNYEYYCQNL